MSILKVEHLTKTYGKGETLVSAVNDVSFTVEKDQITVKAEAYAKSVEILNDQEDLVLSDNYFDLNGDSKTVKILRGNPEGIRLRSVWDIGQEGA